MPYHCVCLKSDGDIKTDNGLCSNAVIQETLRTHPNTGTILERKAPPGGVTIDGYYIPGGVIVGVNAWVLHRDGIFGQDPDKFRPERWLEASEADRTRMNQCLFSVSAPIPPISHALYLIVYLFHSMSGDDGFNFYH